MSLGWVHIFMLPVSYLCFEIGETHAQTQSKRGNPVKLSLVLAVTHGYDFVVMPSFMTLGEREVFRFVLCSRCFSFLEVYLVVFLFGVFVFGHWWWSSNFVYLCFFSIIIYLFVIKKSVCLILLLDESKLILEVYNILTCLVIHVNLILSLQFIILEAKICSFLF